MTKIENRPYIHEMNEGNEALSQRKGTPRYTKVVVS